MSLSSVDRRRSPCIIIAKSEFVGAMNLAGATEGWQKTSSLSAIAQKKRANEGLIFWTFVLRVVCGSYFPSLKKVNSSCLSVVVCNRLAFVILVMWFLISDLWDSVPTPILLRGKFLYFYRKTLASIVYLTVCPWRWEAWFIWSFLAQLILSKRNVTPVRN